MRLTRKELDILSATIREGTAEERKLACYRLQSSFSKRAVQIFMEVLSDENSPARVIAAIMLGERKIIEAVPVLLKWLSRNPSECEKQIVISVLGDIGDPTAVPYLLSELTNASLCLRLRIIAALGRIGDVQAADRILALLNTDDICLKWAVAEALVEIGDCRVIALLEELGRHPDTNQRDRRWVKRSIRRLALLSKNTGVPTT